MLSVALSVANCLTLDRRITKNLFAAIFNLQNRVLSNSFYGLAKLYGYACG